MNYSKRLLICLMIFTFIVILFMGCSKSGTKLNQSTTSRPVATATTPTSSPNNQKSLSGSGNDKDVASSQKLESWVGGYTFSEFAPPNQNMFYSIFIYKENGDYYAKISIDGFQTIERIQTKVSGDEKSIKLSFYKYLPDNIGELYKEGDILLSLEKRNSDIYTSWGKIQPMIKSNTKSGEVYFKIKS